MDYNQTNMNESTLIPYKKQIVLTKSLSLSYYNSIPEPTGLAQLPSKKPILKWILIDALL